MYSFEPTEEQKMLIDTVARYATTNLRPASHDADEENQIPVNLIKKGWELGVLQASTPETYGGFGEHSAITGVLAAEDMEI
jgi:acyl-CoA dehydrogenase